MQVGGWASDGREGGTAEHAHSDSARQVTGLPAVAVPEVEGVQGLEVVRVGFQVHLAQELIFKDSVVPDLHGDGLARLLAVEDTFHIILGCRSALLHGRADFVPLTLDDHVRVSPCRGVFETCSPQDVYLGHLLGIAAQGAPAGAGRLIQAQLPGAGQRRRGGR